MKYLVLIALLAVVYMAWRGKRLGGGSAPNPASRRAAPPDGKGAAPGTPHEMVSCAACGLHLPRDEAVAGSGGLYCSRQHRDQPAA